MKRREFKRMLVQGIGESTEHLGWQRELVEPLEVGEWKENPRCVNDFKIGGDPEFVLVNANGVVVNAADCLNVGLGFGCDQNGRLGELRLAPSRSSLKVVASVYGGIRWMWEYLNKCGLRGLTIQAPPVVYFNGLERWDGCGGHVHFGRKSSEARRRLEIEELDWLFGGLVSKDVWNKKDCQARVQKARYGEFGDYRFQSHGFEYRSFPSWLENPWKAFLVLTLAKLTVHDPSLPRWEVSGDMEKKVDRFLGYYQGLDDDARLAKRCLKRWGLPKEGYGEGFRAWGMGELGSREPIVGFEVVPQLFKVQREDIREVFEHFRDGKVLKQTVKIPDWSPLVLPREFSLALKYTNALRQTGLGDYCVGVAVWDKLPIRFVANGEQGRQIYVASTLAERLPKGWMEEFEKVGIRARKYNDNNLVIQLLRGVRENPHWVRVCKKVLLSGMFPLWKVEEAGGSRLKRWKVESPKIKGISMEV